MRNITRQFNQHSIESVVQGVLGIFLGAEDKYSDTLQSTSCEQYLKADLKRLAIS